MENIKINKPSQTILHDQISSILHETSFKWILLSSDSETLETLKILKVSQHERIVDLMVLDLSSDLSNVLVKEIIDKCISLNIETLGVIDKNYLVSSERYNQISDYIFQPVKTDELKFRIGKLIRSRIGKSDKTIIKIDELTINTTNYEVVVAGEKVHLRFKEYELLLLLASNPGRGYDRASLLNQIWGYDYFGGTRTVDVHIRRLRSKIEKDPNNLFIETIWNVGYRFRTTSKNPAP